MTQVTEDLAEALRVHWRERYARPVAAARAFRDFAAEQTLDASALADLVGAPAAEMLVFLVFADLDLDLQQRLVKQGFSAALIARVVEMDPEEQAAFLQEFVTSERPAEAARVQLAEKREAAVGWMDTLTGPQLMHLSRKTKGYEAFTDRRRRALLDMGKLIRNKKPLSVAQQQYLRSMLTELHERGVLTGDCFEGDCKTCSEIRKAVPN